MKILRTIFLIAVLTKLAANAQECVIQNESCDYLLDYVAETIQIVCFKNVTEPASFPKSDLATAIKAHPQYVYSIAFNNKNYKSVPEAAFVSIANLNCIDLSSNNLLEISPNAFTGPSGILKRQPFNKLKLLGLFKQNRSNELTKIQLGTEPDNHDRSKCV
jgi:hypothetical protein